jgi:hypothetical protein
MTFPQMTDLQNQNDGIANAINRQWGPEVVAHQGRAGAGMLQYWRKCMRMGCPRHTDKFTNTNREMGWVIVGPDMGSPIEHARWINSKHMTPLPQYGSMSYGVDGAANPYTRFKQLIEKGGLRELPVDQIQAYNWDKIPEVAYAHPDLVISRIPCDLGCVNRDFLTEEIYKDHISGWHSEAKGTMAIGAELGKVMRQQQQPQAVDAVAIGAAVSAAIAQMMPMIMAGMQQAQQAPNQKAAKAKDNPEIETLTLD